MTENESKTKASFKWRHPTEVMALHNLKKKKKALQARIKAAYTPTENKSNILSDNKSLPLKRKNPFVIDTDSKKLKPADLDESNDQTLFKLFNLSSTTTDAVTQGKENITSFNNILTKEQEDANQLSDIKVIGEKWVPIDWALKTKLRFLSTKPFGWNQKLKISEEASGITSFVRCLDTSSTATSLDTSSNAKFHQNCLYWQQPVLPWLTLFPRHSKTSGTSAQTPMAGITVAHVKESLHTAYTDSFRSLYQLLRTGQCPYFYACANTFTALFRAAGVGGFTETHALLTPTTRGFRQMLKQEDIEFTMPLKAEIKEKDSGDDNEGKGDKKEIDDEEEWMQTMGIGKEDIKEINYNQAAINHKSECQVDSGESSLILVEGHETQALYNFLLNCRSASAVTGPLAGVPPTLLAPVAFTGATLQALRVREAKVHVDKEDFYSIDLTGPILPHILHKLCRLHSQENSMTATCSRLTSTMAFSKVTKTGGSTANSAKDGSAIFRQENLSDCGLTPAIIKHFCSTDTKHVQNFECLKYTAENSSYAWS